LRLHDFALSWPLPEKATGMKLEQRLGVKLLAQAGGLVTRAVGECLCTQPDVRVIKGMLAEAREMLDDFEKDCLPDLGGGDV
jgi:hypothetical protein